MRAGAAAAIKFEGSGQEGAASRAAPRAAEDAEMEARMLDLLRQRAQQYQDQAQQVGEAGPPCASARPLQC